MSAAHDAAQAEALLAVMRAAGHAGPAARVTALRQLEGGWSRHSHAATVDHGDERGERGYIVRVRPHGTTLDTDLGAEHRTFELLTDEPVPTPAVRGYQPATDTPFGGAFFVMDRLPGEAVNVWRGRDRRRLAQDWEGPRRIASDLADHLATIHRIDPGRAAGAIPARDFAATVDHWESVYHASRLVADPVVDEAFAWARSRAPQPIAPRLVHGDYRIGNCLVQDGRISAILDWELSFAGDPRFDLGYLALDYYAGRFTTPGSPLLNATADHEWFFERYAAASGIAVDLEVVRTFTAIGALMLFAIMTTGIRVYAEGRTADIRMPWSRFVLPGLRQDLVTVMEW